MKGTLLAVLMLAAVAAGQTSYPPPPPGSQPPAAAPTAQLDANQLLAQLEQTSAAINASVGRLRIEKWKTGGDEKHRLQSNADSIQRNISAALPGMVSAARTAPANLAAQFKLYRNVSALYDVFASLSEAAGAFGPKEDFQDLSQEGQQLDTLRRSLGDRLEQLATAQDAELTRLRARAAQAAAAPAKKVIVDDNAPAKTFKKKKKPAGATAQNASKPQQ